MVRFLVVKLTHPGSNPEFSMCVTYLRLIILSVIADIFIDSGTLFVTDFLNLKVKPA
jgi:hypothetical protein